MLIRADHVDRAEAFFRRRGDWAVLVGRVLPVVRTFISLPAGIARVSIGRFTAYTLIGCLPWTFALAGIGYAVAASWDSVASGFTYASIAVVVVIVALIGWWLLRRRRSEADVPRRL